jgi:hypothetical protein
VVVLLQLVLVVLALPWTMLVLLLHMLLPASGAKPVGVLLNDVVNLDLTRQHINWHKDEVQQGGKVTLLQVGQVTTDSVTGAIAAGEPAYRRSKWSFHSHCPNRR